MRFSCCGRCCRSAETRTVYGANVVVFEGILALHDAELNALYDMRIFVDTDDDVRLARRRTGPTQVQCTHTHNAHCTHTHNAHCTPTRPTTPYPFDTIVHVSLTQSHSAHSGARYQRARARLEGRPGGLCPCPCRPGRGIGRLGADHAHDGCGGSSNTSGLSSLRLTDTFGLRCATPTSLYLGAATIRVRPWAPVHVGTGF
jgi:hypothetical protein